MIKQENVAIVTLKKGEGRTIKAGGAWVFNNEIETITGRFHNGDLVIVHDFDGYPMGKGYINQNSKIRVRLLTRHVNQEIDESFFQMRLQNAWNYRKDTVDTSSCRLVFGEADFLPGIVIDKYEDVLVMECLTLGMERYKEQLANLMKQILQKDGIQIRGVYERSDAKEREKEGLSRVKGFIGAEFDTNVEITENGVRYMVDVVNGQKTGFFLDQKYNRLAVAKLSRGKRVLDCFTHTGSFGLNAAKGGAEYVLSVDISESAVEMAQKNAKANGLDGKVEYLAANVFDLLPKLSEGEMINRYGKFDFIILDPPAFTKSRQTVESAMRGYKEINLRAMRLLPRGGYLATCSCSHFMTEQLFVKMLHQAEADAGVSLRQIEARQQSPDHPILWNVEETNYLKFYLFQVV